MNKDCKKSGPFRVRLSAEKENKTGTSQVGAKSKAQKYSRNHYWKDLENIFSKKSIFLKKSQNAEKLRKEAI